MISETYLEPAVTGMDTNDLLSDTRQLFGGLIAYTESTSTAETTSSAENTSGSSSENQPSKHSMKAGITTTRRGRPRLNSKTQSVGEVCYLTSKHRLMY